MATVAKHLGYIGRHGELAIETDEGDRLRSPALEDELPERWDLDLDEHRRNGQLTAGEGGAPPKLVHKLILSMPASTSAEGVLRAARHFLSEEFAGKHYYAFALHTDEPHPHVHLVVKAMSKHGSGLISTNAGDADWTPSLTVSMQCPYRIESGKELGLSNEYRCNAEDGCLPRLEEPGARLVARVRPTQPLGALSLTTRRHTALQQSNNQWLMELKLLCSRGGWEHAGTRCFKATDVDLNLRSASDT